MLYQMKRCHMNEKEYERKFLRLKMNIKGILQQIDPSPYREGLQKTPERVATAMLRDWFWGYQLEGKDILTTGFDAEKYDEMIIEGPIRFYSHCEHHLAPFWGNAYIGYIPGKSGKIVGASKLAQLIHIYSRRLQNQERIAKQIANSFCDVVKPLGFGVYLSGQHMCMCSRKMGLDDTQFKTIVTRGVIRSKQAARMEFLMQINGKT